MSSSPTSSCEWSSWWGHPDRLDWPVFRPCSVAAPGVRSMFEEELEQLVAEFSRVQQ